MSLYYLLSHSLRGVLSACADMEFIPQPTRQACGSALQIAGSGSAVFLLRLLSQLAQGSDALFWGRGAETGEVEQTRHAQAMAM